MGLWDQNEIYEFKAFAYDLNSQPSSQYPAAPAMLLITEQLLDTISQFEPLTAAPKFCVLPSFLNAKLSTLHHSL